ncbi:MAG TPA: hypothetical protein VH518_04375 [Tepidisphaeraceae bacterium]|jgi:hypothetical protein
MRRKLFNLAVVLSLLLFLATTVLWLRGHFVQDVISFTRGQDRFIRLHMKENGLVIASISPWPRREPLTWRWDWTGRQGYGVPVMFDVKTMTSGTVVPGISYNIGTGTVNDPALAGNAATVVRAKVLVIVWLWPLVITLALAVPLTAMVVRRWVIRRKRSANGLCLVCGYDLRASPGRCPECGAISEPPATITAAA